MNLHVKHRLTAFVDSALVKRAKVRGALEELTISQVVERALDAYAPVIENDTKQRIHLKFNNSPEPRIKTPVTKRKIPKRTKDFTVPRK